MPAKAGQQPSAGMARAYGFRGVWPETYFTLMWQSKVLAGATSSSQGRW